MPQKHSHLYNIRATQIILAVLNVGHTCIIHQYVTVFISNLHSNIAI